MVFSISCFAMIAHAWRITPELERELSEKRAAYRANPGDAHTIFDLAITCAYTNRIEEGLELLRRTEKADPGFKDKARVFYARKVTGSPNDWRLRFRYAFSLYFAGNKEEAIKEMRNVLVIDPYNVWAYGYIALIYGEMGETDKAIEAAKAGLEIDNLVAALHLLLSQGYYRKGNAWAGFFSAAQALRLKAQGY